MNLKIQIISLIISFLYGIVFSVLMNINYKYLFHKKWYIKTIVTFVFVIDMALLFFIIMKYINEGIIHYYFYIMISIGFLISFSKTKRIRKVKLLSNGCKKDLKLLI